MLRIFLSCLISVETSEVILNLKNIKSYFMIRTVGERLHTLVVLTIKSHFTKIQYNDCINGCINVINAFFSEKARIHMCISVSVYVFFKLFFCFISYRKKKLNITTLKGLNNLYYQY